MPVSFMVSGCVTTPEPSMEHIVEIALESGGRTI